MKLRLTILAAALLAGCDSALSPSTEVRVETLETTVDLAPVGAAVGALIPFRVVNASDSPVFLAQCGGRIMTAVDRRGDDGDWVQYSGDGCVASLDMSPIELAPNARIASDRWIDEAGVYRFRVGSTRSSQAAIEWRTLSNPFVVR